MLTLQRRVVIGQVIVAAVVAIAAAAALLQFVEGPPTRRMTAYFSSAIGIFPETDVRVLGVKVGQISSITPQGPQVKVILAVDRNIDVPADAKAVIIAPNLVSDRYLQLTPAYNGGPKADAGHVIPLGKTGSPMELDELYTSLRTISAKLGPGGVNAKGALSQFLKTSARNLDGNGRKLYQTIDELGKASATLNNSADDFFATMANLNRFTGMLRANDGQVRLFERQLAEVSTNFANDGGELAGAIAELGPVLVKAKEFIEKHRPLLRKDIDKLAKLTRSLVDQRHSLAEALDVTPLVAQNAMAAYDPETQSLMSRGNLLEITAAYGKGAGTAVPVPVCLASGDRAKLKKICRPAQEPGPPLTDAPPLPLPAAGPVSTGLTR